MNARAPLLSACGRAGAGRQGVGNAPSFPHAVLLHREKVHSLHTWCCVFVITVSTSALKSKCFSSQKIVGFSWIHLLPPSYGFPCARIASEPGCRQACTQRTVAVHRAYHSVAMCDQGRSVPCSMRKTRVKDKSARHCPGPLWDPRPHTDRLRSSSGPAHWPTTDRY